MTGVHATYNSSLTDLDEEMKCLKVKLNSIEPAVGKVSEEIKGMYTSHKENFKAVIIQSLFFEIKLKA